ncbi:MAG: citrate/2-methylcitrate synthase [Lachnospiraceae bacterium]|nr:citrate/2-methylcitrate synthase [Lachnospiraceae bacterium]
MQNINSYSEITPELLALSKLSKEHGQIDPALYTKYEVKRGLRDLNGKGVLAGLTDISEITSYIIEDSDMIPCDGRLYYRGYKIQDLVAGFEKENRFGFEEIAYLLLFGELPDKNELTNFTQILGDYRSLPTHFVRDIIMKAPSKDMMNAMARSILTMYAYDDRADDTSIENVVRQSIQMISLFPLISVYAYHAYNHYHDGASLIIHPPKPELSTAEHFLYLLRPDGQYSDLEAKMLDLGLVLHMEHGGGNNSTFTTHVVSSSGTDTYSSIAAALGSLKGPKHGGANVKVVKMFDDLKANVSDWTNEAQLKDYLCKLLDREAFDHSGLIYGMGHAVYSLSDPRSEIFKTHVASLAKEKGREDELALYNTVERLAKEVIFEKRKIYKGVSANIDFYSGFVYSMLNLPTELFTPMFANARIVGWSAHRLEELATGGKIIRPAYKSVCKKKPYEPLKKR